MTKHALTTRLWHWGNLVCVVVLFMSGLGISNAHRRLYWGHWGFAPEHAWLFVPRFPGWMTIPSEYSLADARLWHLLMAWFFAFGLLAFMIASLINGHFKRDLVTRFAEWKPRAVWADVVKHLKLDFDHQGSKFNFLQKVAYAKVIFILLPLLILTGIAMSPGMDANWPWIVDLFGGRQSARSIHFIAAWALAAFFVIHIVLVLLSDPLKQIRDMIAGGRAEEEAP
jgi:thiosulfate reductase cytochrome b subunit